MSIAILTHWSQDLFANWSQAYEEVIKCCCNSELSRTITSAGWSFPAYDATCMSALQRSHLDYWNMATMRKTWLAKFHLWTLIMLECEIVTNYSRLCKSVVFSQLVYLILYNVILFILACTRSSLYWKYNWCEVAIIQQSLISWSDTSYIAFFWPS